MVMSRDYGTLGTANKPENPGLQGAAGVRNRVHAHGDGRQERRIAA
jgi:hypothetical protein